MMYDNYGASEIQALNPDPSGNSTSTITGSAGNYSLGGSIQDSTIAKPLMKGATDRYTTDGSIQPISDLTNGGLMLDSTIHKDLDSRIWDANEHMIPVVREKLLGIANFFRDLVEFYVVLDIVITGSEANYNYTEYSDIDIHLVYNFQDMGVDPQLLATYFKAKKQLFNNEYDFTIKGIPVELGVEDINNPAVSSGTYSLITDEWLVKPTNSQKEIPDIYKAEAQVWKDKIERAIETHDREVLNYTWKAVKKLRKDSLNAANGGEFAVGNLVFKHLRAEGYIARLAHALTDAISKQLSLENLDTMLPANGEIRSFL